MPYHVSLLPKLYVTFLSTTHPQPTVTPSPPLLTSVTGVVATEDQAISIAFQEKFIADFEKISPKSKTSGMETMKIN